MQKPFELEDVSIDVSLSAQLSEWQVVQLIKSATDENISSALKEVCASNDKVAEALCAFLNED